MRVCMRVRACVCVCVCVQECERPQKATHSSHIRSIFIKLVRFFKLSADNLKLSASFETHSSQQITCR